MEKTRETNLPPASAGREIRRVCSREGWGAFLLMALTQVGAAVLAAALTQLGDTLGTILACRELCESRFDRDRENAQSGRHVL